MAKKKTATVIAKSRLPAPYHPEAFEFLREGLDFTVKKTHGEKADVVRHILRWLQEHQAELSQLPSLLSRGEIPGFIVSMIQELGDLQEATDQLNLHVSGEELCWGLRDLAVQNWGLMAPAVLQNWGIRSTRDFGKMVFSLIDQGLLAKQPDDSIEDFDNVFDFDTAFGDLYRIDMEANERAGRNKDVDDED